MFDILLKAKNRKRRSRANSSNAHGPDEDSDVASDTEELSSAISSLAEAANSLFKSTSSGATSKRSQKIEAASALLTSSAEADKIRGSAYLNSILDEADD